MAVEDDKNIELVFKHSILLRESDLVQESLPRNVFTCDVEVLKKFDGDLGVEFTIISDKASYPDVFTIGI